jgi:hypothetical protein
MASKNLKAIVVRGKDKPQIAHPERLAALNRLGPKNLPLNADMDSLGKLGTPGVVMFQNATGTLPTRNYNEGQFEGRRSDQRRSTRRYHPEGARYLLRLHRALQARGRDYRRPLSRRSILRRGRVRNYWHLWLVLRHR